MRDALRMLAVCNYPSERRPAHQVFVRALLRELTARGVDIDVVAPESVSNLVKPSTGFRLARRLEEPDGIPVHRPRYLRYSAVPLPWGGTSRTWSDRAYARAARRTARNLSRPFDLCFGHFLFPQGRAAAGIAARLGARTVVSLGESSFRRYETAYSPATIGGLLESFSGVITSSPMIKRRCTEHYGLAEDRVSVFPNGVDERLFHRHDRKAARERCRLPLDRPIVIFVGQFIARKGPLRVLDAIRSRPEIGAVFLGQGPQVPDSPQVLYRGVVRHEETASWLNAADVFVLPTLEEGCSNAILEALSCGLPIVTSDLPFNHAIVDERTAILVDPGDTEALSRGIFRLVDQPALRTAMGHAALQHARSFRLSERAGRIHEFMLGLCRSEPPQRKSAN